MAARWHDIYVRRGVTRIERIPVEGDGLTDLIGWSARAQVRAQPTAAAVLHEWTIGGGLTVDGATLVLTIPPAVSTAWLWSRGYYDLLITDPADVVTDLLEGRVIVMPTTTRDVIVTP